MEWLAPAEVASLAAEFYARSGNSWSERADEARE